MTSAQTLPPSGREGDHGSGGRRTRNFIFTANYTKYYTLLFFNRLLYSVAVI